MRCRKKIFEIIAATAVCAFSILGAGCAPTVTNQPAQTVIQPPPLFPPQTAMQGGDYAGFLAENENILKTCQEPEQCQAALFNIGFLYCYPKSPYYNPVKGLKHIEDLVKASPESPWAYQAKVWVELIKKNKVEGRKRQSRDDGRSKEAVVGEGRQIESPPEKAIEGQQEKVIESQPEKQVEGPADGKAEEDRLRLQEEIRSKDAAIKELNRQIERSRQIDMEIEKKERGLLY
jgi:hypothetical protein